MSRFLVLTTVKPPSVPADTDLTYPTVYRIVGDPGWESVNGYCKYLSKYPLTSGKPSPQNKAPILPVAGLEFQTEHVAASAADASTAAWAWISPNLAGWGVPSVWSSTGYLVYTMVSDTIGVPSINTSVLPITL